MAQSVEQASSFAPDQVVAVDQGASMVGAAVADGPIIDTTGVASAMNGAINGADDSAGAQDHAASNAPSRNGAHHEEEPGIVVSSRPLAPDPARAINMASFAVTQALDSAVLEPFSKGYEAVVPSPVRDGIHNVLYNLREPVIAANYLMQHKIGKTGETIARFVINSTIGLAGIFDMAKRKPFKLGYHENGFADTLGFMAWVTGHIFICPCSVQRPCAILRGGL
jgi:phospholipid-binding lipoprotein MlaA